jgi:hypothetical protein
MPSSHVKVMFHIGLEKTGTTSFQRFCTRHARRLLKHDVLYPKRSSAFHALNHAPLTASYLPLERPYDFHLQSTAASCEMVKSLKCEIESSGVPTVIISSEHLSSRFRAPQIVKLADDFNEYECQVVIVLRNHFSRFFSSYSTHVMSGSVQTLDEYAEMVLLPDNLYMRYADTIKLWESSFGVKNLIILNYDESSNIIYSILSKIGIRGLRNLRIDAHKSNASLDANATEALRLFTIASQSEREYKSKTPYLEFIKQQYVRSVLRNKLQSDNYPNWRLSLPYSKQLFDISEADSVWLAKNYALSLSSVKKTSLPEANSESAQRDVPILLARTLAQTMFARWSIYRLNMVLLAVFFLALKRLRGIR